MRAAQLGFEVPALGFEHPPLVVEAARLFMRAATLGAYSDPYCFDAAIRREEGAGRSSKSQARP